MTKKKISSCKQTKGKIRTPKKPKAEDTIEEDEHNGNAEVQKEPLAKEPTSKEPLSKEPMSKEPTHKEKTTSNESLDKLKAPFKKLLNGKDKKMKSKEKDKEKTSREKKLPSVSSLDKTSREKPKESSNDEKIVEAVKGLCRYVLNMKESSLNTYFDEQLSKYTPSGTYVEWERNMSKNRSKVYKVNDSSRVHLDISGKDSYINASHVKFDSSCSEFILTQYPLKETIHDFWRMVSQKKVTRIITIFEPYVDEAIEEFNKVPSVISSPAPMSTIDSVNGTPLQISQKSQTRDQIMSMSVRCDTNQTKSSFFPLFTDHYMNLDNWLINTRKVEIDDRNKNWMSLYTVEIVADECSEASYIRVFNCTTWPWKKVPDEEKKLLALVRAPVKDTGALVTKQDKTEPIVVMCDLGLDRSATVVLTTVIIELVLAGKTPDCDALFKKMRDQRPHVFTMSIFYSYAIRAALFYLQMKLKSFKNPALSSMIQDAINKVPFVSNPKK